MPDCLAAEPLAGARSEMLSWNGCVDLNRPNLAGRGTAEVRVVTRAKIVLAAAGRCSNAEIAAQVGVHVDTVRRVRSRFVVEGTR